jgi:hypothetical protein
MFGGNRVCRSAPLRTKPRRTAPNRAGPTRFHVETAPNRAEPDRAGPRRTKPRRTKPRRTARKVRRCDTKRDSPKLIPDGSARCGRFCCYSTVRRGIVRRAARQGITQKRASNANISDSPNSPPLLGRAIPIMRSSMRSSKKNVGEIIGGRCRPS